MLHFDNIPSNLYQRQIISLIKKSLIQLQMEDNNLGTLVVSVHHDTIHYIHTQKHKVKCCIGKCEFVQ